jgi:hypothetical protein
MQKRSMKALEVLKDLQDIDSEESEAEQESRQSDQSDSDYAENESVIEDDSDDDDVDYDAGDFEEEQICSALVDRAPKTKILIANSDGESVSESLVIRGEQQERVKEFVWEVH